MAEGLSVYRGNPLGGVPTLMFVEEEVLQKADSKTSSEVVANLHVTFSQDNPLHTEVYRILNLIYEEERTKRDAAEVANSGLADA